MAATHDPFPTLRIRRDGLQPRGVYAVNQARYLAPDPAAVARLQAALVAGQAGVVAHFYMDPELQGVLAACDWPHIHVSDSLVMADRAVEMVRAGAKRVAVLGVDFMSENVRAMLDAAGLQDVPVHRVATDPIGCSLAEAADALAYGAYLQQAAATPRALHVVYINTSLLAKARASALVPTITCTSSNVVRTVLQTFAQVEGAHVFFGPDTYMGRNLRTLFEGAVALGDEACRALHPAHDAASVRDALTRLHHFEQGACVVHHLFGAEVVRRVRAEHPDALYSAHLEVPGEMFALAADAARQGRGVVGSTSNILHFIEAQVAARAADARDGEVLEVVLGTEAGMITPIVRSVQAMLARAGSGLAVDVIFPVAADAVAVTDDDELGIVPGVLGGEGCSTAGGCATCPYMKMNTLQGLCEVLETDDEAGALDAFRPRTYAQSIVGRTVAAVGSEPILAMRAFSRDGALPDALVARIVGG
ncbi:MAG: quinolinate synthase NadA [Deltaproteobacteria bacterium]|nr:quinolinate synthase NadA [Deltaproteobacteria bacterium]